MTAPALEISPKLWSHRSSALVAIFFACLSIAMLFASGAPDSGFGDHEDEPGHLVSSLLIHDYVASGFSESPVTYAKDYYLHYPKVTIGHWPPMVPGVTAVWMLVFGATTPSLLVFFSLLGASIATVIYLGARRRTGDLLAALFGGLFLLTPLVQTFGHHVMTELPLALFGTLAALQFGRFVETGEKAGGLWFGVFAAFAILTKGSAMALALLPLLAIALAGRWELLRRPVLWGAAAIPALLCAPWYIATLGISTSSWAGGSTPTWDHTWLAAYFYPGNLVSLAGYTVGFLALAGFLASLAFSSRKSRWGTLALWVPLAMLPYVLVPTGVQARHLIPVLPAFLMMAALGASWFQRRFPKLSLGELHLVAALALVEFALIFVVVRKDVHGYMEAAQAIANDEGLLQSIVMVESDAAGEGAFISAMALAEERPGHIVLRGSKMLASSDWMGKNYQAHYASSAEMQSFLAQVPVEIVAVDESAGRDHRHPHVDVLLQAIEENPDLWQLVERYDLEIDGGLYPDSLVVYRQLVPPDHPRPKMTFDQVVGRDLSSNH
ncbi:MAG: hypothetical protein ACI8X5_001680 [Planctomycetota bacterium]|jgi:hypothetical protein